MAREKVDKQEKENKKGKPKKTKKEVEQKKLKRTKLFKLILLGIVLFLINLYIVLGIIYKRSDFTISLDYEKGQEASLIIYESPEDKTQKTYLKCEDIDFLSDMSIDWVPEDINDEADGSHHGHHFMAYTFYAENQGKEPVNYWMSAHIEDHFKEVDEAVRFMVYKNGERKVYAKWAKSGNPEPGTIPFIDEETIMLEKRQSIMPGEIDKYTIVIFLEGDDPQCVNSIIGGEISMYMTITEEHITDENELPEEYLKKLLEENQKESELDSNQESQEN